MRPYTRAITLDADALAKAYKAHEEDGLSWDDIAARIGIGRHALQKQLRSAGYELSTRITSGPKRERRAAPAVKATQGFDPRSQEFLMRKLR